MHHVVAQLSPLVVNHQSMDHHPYLDTLGIVVNSNLRCLICESCQCALTPIQVQPHLSYSHANAHIHIDPKLFESAVKAMDVLSMLPPVPDSGSFPQVQGLKLFQGIGCEFCVKPFGETSGMLKHHRENHSHEPIPRHWRIAFYQQFHPKYARTLFEVVPKTSHQSTTIDDLIANLQEDLLPATSDVVVTRARPRMISPWLRTTKWHEHVAPFPVAELRALVATPKKEELPGLALSIQFYFARATKLIETTDELVLQYLNSPDPAKE